MGQKKPARANRVGVWVRRENDSEARLVSEHESTWFAGYDNFASRLEEDWLIREQVKKQYGAKAGISRVRIQRKSQQTIVDIFAIRAAYILGRDNQQLEKLVKALESKVSGKVKVNVLEASYSDPKVIAEKIAIDLEKRIAFRKACKTAIQKAMSNQEVIGIKVMVSGRLGGAEIARSEWYLEGKVPLHTLYANIDNGFAEADTTYGKIGVKVSVNRTVGSNYERAQDSRPQRNHNKRR